MARESASAASHERFYLPELDVLRFFAFLTVFAWHVAYVTRDLFYTQTGINIFAGHETAYRLFTAGEFGVDLFFALSAYLLTELLLRERATTGRVDVKWFYARRVLRIWPLHFFYLILAFGLSRVAGVAEVPSFYFISMSLLVGNFAVAAFGGTNLIAHLWSVCIEEQFYLVWPQVARRISRPALVQVGIALLAVSLTARLGLLAGGCMARSTPVMFNTFSRLDGMGAGILVAAASRQWPRNLGALWRLGIVAVGATSWLGVVSFWPDRLPQLLGILANSVVAFGCAAFLVAALGATDKRAGVVLKPLTYLGKISYGLYVYHPLATRLSIKTCLAGRSSPDRTTLLLHVLLSFSIDVVMAALSYRLLETPFLNLKRRFTYVPSRPV